jgi:transcriptional regulator with XRE-family HTH domain
MMAIEPSAFGNRLRALRLQRGFASPEAFARHAGLPGITIRHLEDGRRGRRPRAGTIQALAAALDVSITELMPDTSGVRAHVLAGGQPQGRADIHALAHSLGRRASDLIVLDKRHDPFSIGSPADCEQAEWFAGLWHDHQFPAGVHLRRIHYRLLSYATRLPDGRLYENTEADYNFLNNASRYARILQLVPADQFDDRRNPPPRFYAFAGTPPEPRAQLAFDGAWWLPEIDTNLDSGIYYPLPTPAVSGYEYSAADQPYHLEVWIEKSTMDDVLVPLCEAYYANLVTSAGMQSITNAVKLLQRIARVDKPVRVLYISDFDPGGLVMPVGVARQVEFWRAQYAPDSDLKLHWLALTRAQVEQYQLTRTPIKKDDKRRGNFEDRHDEGAVELDALEALYPGTLGQLVREALAAYRDATLPARLEAVRRETTALCTREWRFVHRNVRG